MILTWAQAAHLNQALDKLAEIGATPAHVVIHRRVERKLADVKQTPKVDIWVKGNDSIKLSKLGHPDEEYKNQRSFKEAYGL